MREMSHGVFCSHHCELGELRQAGLREMKGCQLLLDEWQTPDILAVFWGAPGAGQGGGWAGNGLLGEDHLLGTRKLLREPR